MAPAPMRQRALFFPRIGHEETRGQKEAEPLTYRTSASYHALGEQVSS